MTITALPSMALSMDYHIEFSNLDKVRQGNAARTPSPWLSSLNDIWW